MEYQTREVTGKGEGQDWATNRRRPIASLAIDSESLDYDDIIACLTETKASHYIPRSYRHAIATDPERWMVPMKVEMETLKGKHTWDLVKPPPGVNIMDSMWIYDIKWDVLRLSWFSRENQVSRSLFRFSHSLVLGVPLFKAEDVWSKTSRFFDCKV